MNQLIHTTSPTLVLHQLEWGIPHAMWRNHTYAFYLNSITNSNGNTKFPLRGHNMFRAIILPIFRNTRLCVTACGIMHTRCCRPATLNTQSSVPEVGQNSCPKHFELTGIFNKPLLLHLVGCLYYLYLIIFF
jgi:hypothetical protein